MDWLARNLWRVPALPSNLEWPWWSNIDHNVKVAIKDAFEASFWLGVSETLPYVFLAGAFGYFIGSREHK